MRLHPLIISLLIIASFTGCDFKSADTYLKESGDAEKKGDYTGAINLVSKAIHKNPRLKEAYIQRGLFYETKHRDDSAINDYKTLLAFDPGNTAALYHTGLCKYRQNKYEEAIENYNKALITKGITNLSDTSSVQTVSNPDTSGVPSIQTAFDIQPAQIYYKRGMAYYTTKQIKKAYLDFQNCIAQNYNLDECFFMSGLCWRAADKNDKACEAFKKSSAFGNYMAKNHLNNVCK